ncbi:hypothetical protein [Thermofilum sp.]|jgi:hypothetical protein|uniref:hypothetical protein n=1 Tax=Thermofilum sp. TaxID=1961369 RepID=UPI00258AE35B|nr:hypothetical protein [Thermofilum sp.]
MSDSDIVIEQKIRETIKRLTREPVDTTEFKTRFEEETGWEYTFDSFPKLLKEEQKGRWTYETRECVDYVDIDETTYVSIHAVELWVVDYEKGDMYIDFIDIKEIKVNKE